jgi:hypothetical protein
MSAELIARAAGWFLLLLAGALGLDGFDRYRRMTGLKDELARAERAGAEQHAARFRPDGTARFPPLPLPADDSDALRRLPAMPARVVFDPDVRDRVYSNRDSVSENGGQTWRTMTPDEVADREAATSTPTVVPGGGLTIDGVEAPAPGRIVGVSRALDGTVYVRISDANRFSLWFTKTASDPWRPIGGAGPVEVMAAGEPGVLYVGGRQLGCWRDGAWMRTDWPDRFEPTSLRAHPRAPLVVALGRGEMVVSRDGGRTLRRVRFGGRGVFWVGLDPFQSEEVLIEDPFGAVFALVLGRLR